MLDRREPLTSGRDTEIDMIEREMEGGVVVIQPLEVHEHSVDERLGGVIRIEQDVNVRKLETTVPAVPKASGRPRRAP